MKNRYLFFRNIYREYIIFFIEKKELKTYDIDTNILSLIKTKDNIIDLSAHYNLFARRFRKRRFFKAAEGFPQRTANLQRIILFV